MKKQVIQWMAIAVCLFGLLSCATKTTEKTVTDSGKNEVAQADPRTVVEEAPDLRKAALINVELGLGYLNQGQVARAKEKLTHAVKLAPRVPETHSALAHFLEMVGEYKDAEKEHRKAIRLAKVGAVYNNYGAYLCRRQKYKEADKAFHLAIADKEYPRTAEVYENLGLCALKSQHKEEAIGYLLTALRRDPSRVTALIELSEINLGDGNVGEAKKFLEHYKKVAQPSAESLWLGIRIDKALHDDSNVAGQALMLKNLFEDSAEYQLYLQSEKAQL